MALAVNEILVAPKQVFIAGTDGHIPKGIQTHSNINYIYQPLSIRPIRLGRLLQTNSRQVSAGKVNLTQITGQLWGNLTKTRMCFDLYE